MGLVQAGSARWEGCDCEGQVVPAAVFPPPPVRCGSLAVLLSSVSWRPPAVPFSFVVRWLERLLAGRPMAGRGMMKGSLGSAVLLLMPWSW